MDHSKFMQISNFKFMLLILLLTKIVNDLSTRNSLAFAHSGTPGAQPNAWHRVGLYPIITKE